MYILESTDGSFDDGDCDGLENIQRADASFKVSRQKAASQLRSRFLLDHTYPPGVL